MERTTFSTYNSKLILSNTKKSSHDSSISSRSRHTMRKRNHSEVVVHTKIRPYSTTIDSIESSNKFDKYQGPSSIILKRFFDSTPKREPLDSMYFLGIDNHDHIDEREKKKKREKSCCLFISLCALCCLLMALGIAAMLIALLYKQNSTSKATTTTTRVTKFNVNMIMNGDAEIGPCSLTDGFVRPEIWNYNGNVTQVSYISGLPTYQNLTTPGPSDRGNCYFCGGYSLVSSMWQTIDLSQYIDSYFIDNQIIKYNLSAWIGGYQEQDDCSTVFLTFLNQSGQMINSSVQIGPAIALTRGNVTQLTFLQVQGLVPIGTRFFNVEVIFSRLSGLMNHGNIDNIAVTVYQ